MYKIVGGDGKEYGPVNIDVIRQWLKEGRANAQTRIQAEGQEWKGLAEYPELAALLPNRVAPPAPVARTAIPSAPAAERSSGLAITSLVLGILSLLGCFMFTGIPAVICGHIARNRAFSSPDRYGGGGLALGGLITGYIGLALSILVLPAALFFPAFFKARDRAISINCMNNMKQIGLAYRTWEIDHNDQFPWEVSVEKGGTMEVAPAGRGTINPNPIQFEVLSNELVTPRILVCPADKSKTAALNFRNLKPGNVSYELRTIPSLNSSPTQVLAICPIHHSTLWSDGSVHLVPRTRRQTY